MVFIGIDPGLSGGIGVMDGDGEIITCLPMPIFQGKKKHMDTKQVAELLSSFTIGNSVFVTLEKQIPFGGKSEMVLVLSTGKKLRAMIGQSVSSTAYFQQQYGELIGVCVALQIPFITVAPITWKKDILEGLPWKGGNKAASIMYVQQRWPEVNLLPTSRCRKPSDGLAEAICLAEYGRKEKNF